MNNQKIEHEGYIKENHKTWLQPEENHTEETRNTRKEEEHNIKRGTTSIMKET